MARIHFKCPRCGTETEVQLEASSSLLLLSCGRCRCPLMYFAGQAFEIDDMEFTNLQDKQMKAVEGFLRIHRSNALTESPDAQHSRISLKPVKHKAGEPVRELAIADDDITDLIIDLQTSEDVDEFLRRLG